MTDSLVEKLKQQCMWCDNIALFECDAVIGMSAQVGLGGTVVYAALDNLEVWTCDALMCLLHRHVAGFFCGGKDHSGTMDRCPYCAANDARGGPMLKEEAEELRRRRHAEIRRAQFRVQR